MCFLHPNLKTHAHVGQVYLTELDLDKGGVCFEDTTDGALEVVYKAHSLLRY